MARPERLEVERVAGEEHLVGGQEAGVAERVAGQAHRCRALVAPLLDQRVDAARRAAEELAHQDVAGLGPREHPADVDVGVLDHRRVVTRGDDRRAALAQVGAAREVVGVPVGDGEPVRRDELVDGLVGAGVDDQPVDVAGVGQPGNVERRSCDGEGAIGGAGDALHLLRHLGGEYDTPR